MILKKAGDHDITTLRTICLFEADFNHNNKYLGKQMIKNAQIHGTLQPEQYSVPGKRCIDHVLNQRLLFDIKRYQKTSFVMSAVDLASCYDRISHPPAYLAMRSHGIPSEPIESMLSTFQDTRFYTKTVHGISSKSFGGLQEGFTAKPNGVGQGNGAVPAIWSVTSSNMFQVLKENGHSSFIITPLSKKELKVCGFAVVDDTDLIATSDSNNAKEAHRKMQEMIKDWDEVARVTGGALKANKSWCWIVEFDWNKGYWGYKNLANREDLAIYAKDKDGKITTLKPLPPTLAQEMLGVLLSPDGNDSQHKQKLIKKMTTLGEYIRCGSVNGHEAWMGLSLIAMKTLEYSIPALTLSEKDYKEIFGHY